MDHMERDCTPGPATGGLSRPALTSRTRGRGLAQGKAIDNARRGQTRVASSSRSDGKKRRATQTCKPGSVTRGAAPQSGGTADGDHLSSPPKATWAIGHPRSAGRCYHRGRAANPGTGRAPIVPLFGLAPGGVWPSLCHHRRPDALTVRFHPYPDESGRYVSVPLSVPRGGGGATEAWALPSTLPGGARTFLPPDESGRRSPSLPGSPSAL